MSSFQIVGVAEPTVTLLQAKSSRIISIKAEAASRIFALEWRLCRARERAEINAEGESVSEVLEMREAIRQASNEAEDAVKLIENVEDVLRFVW